VTTEGASIPETLNLADVFLDARVREGRGARTAIVCGERRLDYADVQRLANRYGHALRSGGVRIEERVVVALPDGPDFAAALFGTLKLGASVVMVNPGLATDEIRYFLDYTRARRAVVSAEAAPRFAEAARGLRHFAGLLVVGGEAEVGDRFSPDEHPEALETEPTHRDDVALWLFSGGTTGRPKAVLQSHGSFLNTTRLYAQRTLGYREDDVTLSVPKLYFGYATGSNLFFPFSVGASTLLFPEKPTPERLFELIAAHRPTILVSVPTSINQMLAHPAAESQDLSCLRFATSAGEALPVELHERWNERFGVELLDGLGTAEMWHIFVTNRPGDVRPGTLGRVVEGFEVRLCDEAGDEVPTDEVGTLRVRGGSLGRGYWQQPEKTAAAFQGEWYVSGDLLSRDSLGYFRYAGRGDELLKVGGRWVAPQQVEGCLLDHPAVRECAVVGARNADGLVKPKAFVVPNGAGSEATAEALMAWVRERLEPFKAPREIVFLDSLPRTHLGKVDRGRLRSS